MPSPRPHSRPPVCAIAVCAIFFLASAAAQTPLLWRYDLRAGDHLTYRYSYERETKGREEQTRIEARFHTHVLVVGATAGANAGANAERISLGFQRNREAADMTEYLSKGKDRLVKELPDFQARMKKRPARFSEAMEISPTDEPGYSWEIARESSIRLLDSLHEVMSLPPGPIKKGDAWRGTTLPDMEFRWVDDESIHGKMCHRVEGALTDRSLKVSYWWSPESGVIEQIVFDETYADDETHHETARMELESRVRGESLEKWLGSADTRLGTLQAILLAVDVPISAAQLGLVLATDEGASSDPAAQALALAIARRRKIDLPTALLGPLRSGASEQVRTLVRTSARTLTDEVSSNSESPQTLTDECHRAVPSKQTPVKFGTLIQAAAATKENPEIGYFLRIPLSYQSDRPAPLLVYLSGGAGFAIDGVSTAEDSVAETDYLVLYPQAARYWWTPESARRFDAVFNDVVQRYNVDRDRVYLTGFSNGGTGTLYFATFWPQRFAAAVSLMGAGQCNEQVKAGLGNLRNLPLLFVHGEDDRIITPDCSTTTHDALVELNPGFKPELKILPKHGHDVTLISDDGLALAFFKGKVRNPFPRTVDLSESDALAARAYWVEIVDGKPGKSDIDARVKADNTIDIHSHDVKRIRLHLRQELLQRPGDIRIVWNGKKMFEGPLRDRCALAAEPAVGDPKLDLTDVRDLTLP